MRVTLAFLALALCAADASAGPILNRIRERRQQHAGCVCGSSCACASGVCPSRCPADPAAFAGQSVVPAVQWTNSPPVYVAPASACPSCSGGRCQVPGGFTFPR